MHKIMIAKNNNIIAANIGSYMGHYWGPYKPCKQLNFTSNYCSITLRITCIIIVINNNIIAIFIIIRNNNYNYYHNFYYN